MDTPVQGDRELAQLHGVSPAAPIRKATEPPLHTEASFINHLYQAHVCSAMVHDGTQELTWNLKGGTWLQDPAQRGGILLNPLERQPG